MICVNCHVGYMLLTDYHYQNRRKCPVCAFYVAIKKDAPLEGASRQVLSVDHKPARPDYESDEGLG